MAASTSTVVTTPNNTQTAPGSGALYTVAGTLAHRILGVGGQALILQKKDFDGSGQVLIDQQGVAAACFGTTQVPVTALQLVGQLFLISSPSDQIPAPDFSAGDGSGTSSYRRLAVSGIIDWVGGIAAPVLAGAASPFGCFIRIINNSGSGNVLNVLDVSIGGAVRMAQPCIALGFYEFIDFTYDNFGWSCCNSNGGMQLSGGQASSGSRLLRTTNATPTWLMRLADPSIGYTPGGAGFVCDVVATTVAGAYYAWHGVTAAWDASSAEVINASAGVPVVSEQGGNAAGVSLVGSGMGLSLSHASSFLNLLATGVAATTITWRCINFRTIAGF